eukprot:5083406-Prymnesium_polylepis.1
MGNVRVDRNHTTYTSTSVSEMLRRRDQGPPCARPNRPIKNRPMQYGGKPGGPCGQASHFLSASKWLR